MDIQGPARQPNPQTAATVDYNAYTTEVEDSLVLAHNWGDLLSAAPLALRFVGECMFVAASPMAASIMMEPPQGGFKYLKSEYPCPTLALRLTKIAEGGSHCKLIWSH
jgi:hypothetical protein